MCKRNSPDKTEASTGCVRETPQIKFKPAWEVSEKHPKVKASKHGTYNINSPDKKKKKRFKKKLARDV